VCRYAQGELQLRKKFPPSSKGFTRAVSIFLHLWKNHSIELLLHIYLEVPLRGTKLTWFPGHKAFGERQVRRFVGRSLLSMARPSYSLDTEDIPVIFSTTSQEKNPDVLS